MNVMYKGEYTEKIRKSMDNDLGDLLDLCNLVSLFYHSILLICTHMMSPRHSKISSSSWLPIHVRKLSDAEVAARAVVRHILKTPPFITSNSKLAFLFLTPGTLPFEKLWDKFFTVSSSTKRVLHLYSLICSWFLIWKGSSRSTSTRPMNGRFISVATFLIEKSTVMRSLRVESLWLMPRRGYWLVLLKILTTNTLFFSQRGNNDFNLKSPN